MLKLDNFTEWARHEAEREPAVYRCCLCDRPINNEFAYEIEGNYYCAECIDNSRTWIEEE